MNMIYKIAKTELQMLFYSPVAWLVLIIFTFQSGMIFSGMIEMIEREQAMGYDPLFISSSLFNRLFYSVQDYLFLYIPLLTMGLVSRDLSGGTIKLLHSSPMTNTQIILGKFLSMMIFALLLVGIFVVYVIYCLFVVENFDVCYILTGILGIYLLICTYASIGLFMSTISSYQIIAAVGTFGVILLLLLWPSLVNFLPTSASGSLVGFLLLWTLCVVILHRVTSHNLLAFVLEAAGIVALVGAYVAKKSMFDRALVNLVEKIAVKDVFQNFANNYIFDAGGLIYYASIIFLLVFLTVQSVEKRRWS